MYKACRQGYFPDIDTMCQYGLTGYQGSNPIETLGRYQAAIKRGMTEDDLQNALKNGTLSELIGYQVFIAPCEYHECTKCGLYSLKKICSCTINGGDARIGSNQ